MIILHCIKKETWQKVKDTVSFGKEYIETDGFIHCSPVEYFWRVTPNFRNINEALVLLCIETDKVTAPIKWEDSDNCGRAYPHIYGELNLNAVVDILDYLKDSEGNYRKNIELESYPNQ